MEDGKYTIFKCPELNWSFANTYDEKLSFLIAPSI